MLTGYQTAPDGRRFILCPEPGVADGKCMASDDQGALRVVPYDREVSDLSLLILVVPGPLSNDWTGPGVGLKNSGFSQNKTQMVRRG